MRLDSVGAECFDCWILRLSDILVRRRGVEARRCAHSLVLLCCEIGKIAKVHVFDVSVLGAKVECPSLSRVPCERIDIARCIIRWPDLAEEGQSSRVPKLHV